MSLNPRFRFNNVHLEPRNISWVIDRKPKNTPAVEPTAVESPATELPAVEVPAGHPPGIKPFAPEKPLPRIPYQDLESLTWTQPQGRKSPHIREDLTDFQSDQYQSSLGTSTSRSIAPRIPSLLISTSTSESRTSTVNGRTPGPAITTSMPKTSVKRLKADKDPVPSPRSSPSTRVRKSKAPSYPAKSAGNKVRHSSHARRPRRPDPQQSVPATQIESQGSDPDPSFLHKHTIPSSPLFHSPQKRALLNLPYDNAGESVTADRIPTQSSKSLITLQAPPMPEGLEFFIKAWLKTSASRTLKQNIITNNTASESSITNITAGESSSRGIRVKRAVTNLRGRSAIENQSTSSRLTTLPPSRRSSSNRVLAIPRSNPPEARSRSSKLPLPLEYRKSTMSASSANQGLRASKAKNDAGRNSSKSIMPPQVNPSEAEFRTGSSLHFPPLLAPEQNAGPRPRSLTFSIHRTSNSKNTESLSPMPPSTRIKPVTQKSSIASAPEVSETGQNVNDYGSIVSRYIYGSGALQQPSNDTRSAPSTKPSTRVETMEHRGQDIEQELKTWKFMPKDRRLIIYDPILDLSPQDFLNERWTLEKFCEKGQAVEPREFRIRGTRESLNHDRLKCWVMYNMHVGWKPSWPPGYTRLCEESHDAVDLQSVDSFY